MVSLGGLGVGMAGGATVAIVIRAIDGFSNTFAKASGGMKLLGGFAKVGGAAILGMTAAVGILGVTSAKSAMKVETGFAKVNTLLDEGEDASEIFADSVKDLNIVLGNQGDQLSVLDGLYQTISAGITDTAEAETFLASASKAAVGGSAPLPTVIEAGTKALAAFGLEINDTDRVFDVFAGTVKAGQTTMGELAQAFPQIAGLAGAMGMTIEETGGVFAGLTKILKDSDKTAIGMKAILTQLLKPQEDLQEGLKQLGFESGQAAVEQLGLMGTLNALKDTVNGDNTALGQMFGNVRAITAVLPAVGLAADDVAESLDIISNSAGLADKQFEDMADTTEYKFGAALSELKNAFIDMGAEIIPALLPLVKLVSEDLAPILKELAPIITEAFTGALNFLLPVIEKLLPHIQRFADLLFNDLFPVLQPLFDALMPIVDLMLEMGMDLFEALIPAIVMLVPPLTRLVEALMPLLNMILPPLIILIDMLARGLAIVIGWVVDLAAIIVNALTGAIQGMVDDFADFKNEVKAVFDWVENLYNKIKDFIELIQGGVASGVGAVGDFVSGLFSSKKVNDFIITSGGQVIEPSPQDTIIGTKNPGSLGGGATFNINIENLSGLDADTIATSLQEQLSTMIS